MPDMPIASYFSKPIVRQAIAIVTIAIFLAGGLYYFLRDEPLPPPKPDKAERQASGVENLIFSGSSIVEHQDGKRLWELNADNIVTDINTKKVRLSKVTGIFYQENKNNGKIDLAAGNAVLDTDTRDIELKNQVRITHGDGTTLTAPQANWDNKARKFLASGGITFFKEDVVITGETMEASVDLERVVVKGKARIVKGGEANAGL